MDLDQHKTLTVDAGKWASFCDRFTEDPQRVVYLEAVIADIDALNGLVAESLATITSSFEQPQSRRIRVFRENTLDYALTERITFDGYSSNNPLDWLNYLGGHEQLCIAVNDLDAWGSGLAETCAAELVPPLSDHLERNWLVIDWYGFISTGGWTPFGIHADDEPSLLFNLGPGSKMAWIWHPDVLPELNRGRPTSLYFEALLGDAIAYTLRPGDVIAIPAGHFHILKSEAPCTLLGAGLYNVSYTAELAAFLSSKAAYTDGDGVKIVDNMVGLLPAYLDDVRHRSSDDQLGQYVSLLRAKTKSLSFSRRPRYGPPTTAVDDFVTQEFIVAQHPILIAADRVIVANGKAVAVPTESIDGAALRMWLRGHPQFWGRDYLGAFAPDEADQALEIANQLLRQGNLRLGGQLNA
ncbi:hypothetical protein [Mycobacteroides salmoniphilum]|uniref:hypothetical protein n=1 Tax=Mycobacteroides salmoniphilum TaxID=404941 RepID=UPI0010652143|nr:hypothetical protein [Mycobacteroides salmoniphilum]TDZ77131.1 hypothetical protein DE4586_02917 [Mycobacteroides salmoniphilum]TDZ86834.1 hypothetical protein DE4587_02221 [Mycobacteroides salmoniphilum]